LSLCAWGLTLVPCIYRSLGLEPPGGIPTVVLAPAVMVVQY
jgi:hypothetical protein